jgi:hypothetical protein
VACSRVNFTFTFPSLFPCVSAVPVFLSLNIVRPKNCHHQQLHSTYLCFWSMHKQCTPGIRKNVTASHISEYLFPKRLLRLEPKFIIFDYRVFNQLISCTSKVLFLRKPKMANSCFCIINCNCYECSKVHAIAF